MPSSAPAIDFPRASGVFPPEDHTPDGLRSWIGETVRYLGITPTEFSREAKLAASTLNRFLRELDETTLSARTIEALLDTARRIETERTEEAPNFASVQHERPFLMDVSVLGKAGHKDFHEATAWTNYLYRLRLPIKPPFHRAGLGAFEITDWHAFPVFPKGSLVVASPLIEVDNTRSTIDPRDGDYVLVFMPEGEKWRRLDLTVRRISISPNGDMWLAGINRELETLTDLFVGPKEDWNRRIPKPFALIHQSITYFPVDALRAN